MKLFRYPKNIQGQKGWNIIINKIMAAVFAGSMVPCMAVPALAIEREPRNIHQSGGEQDGMIVHTLKRTLSAVSENAVKEALIGLGMDERVVARMESDVLEELAAAEEIHAVIAYYEIDVHDRTVCVVPEETALAGAERSNAISPAASDYDANQYVKVVTTTNRSSDTNGKRTYMIQTSFTWLTDPGAFGGTDFLGASSSNCTFNRQDASGSISYRHKKYSGKNVVSDQVETKTQTPKLQTNDDGEMLGIGFDFDLSITRYSSSTGLKTDEYSEWYGYLICKGVIADPAIGSFYHSGTYLHQFSAITGGPAFILWVLLNPIFMLLLT